MKFVLHKKLIAISLKITSLFFKQERGDDVYSSDINHLYPKNQKTNPTKSKFIYLPCHTSKDCLLYKYNKDCTIIDCKNCTIVIKEILEENLQ